MRVDLHARECDGTHKQWTQDWLEEASLKSIVPIKKKKKREIYVSKN